MKRGKQRANTKGVQGERGNNMKKKLCAMVLGILTAMSITACGTNSNEVQDALKALYEQDFSYVETQKYGESEWQWTGEMQASPYLEHRDMYEASQVINDIYYTGSGKMITAKISDKKGKWVTQPMERPRFYGYGEELTILSSGETEDKKYTKYETQYTSSVKAGLGSADKVSYTVNQEYYLDKDTGNIVRIVTDTSDLTKASTIAGTMNTSGKTEEEVRKSLDWNDDDIYTVTVEITYGSVDIEIPE